jgi:hypothetical protein
MLLVDNIWVQSSTFNISPSAFSCFLKVRTILQVPSLFPPMVEIGLSVCHGIISEIRAQ